MKKGREMDERSTGTLLRILPLISALTHTQKHTHTLALVGIMIPALAHPLAPQHVRRRKKKTESETDRETEIFRGVRAKGGRRRRERAGKRRESQSIRTAATHIHAAEESRQIVVQRVLRKTVKRRRQAKAERHRSHARAPARIVIRALVHIAEASRETEKPTERRVTVR